MLQVQGSRAGAGVTEIYSVESAIVRKSKPEVGVVALTSGRYQK